MTIPYSQLPAFVSLLQDASRDEKLWLAFDSRIQMLSVNDLHLLDTKSQADDFVHFNKTQGRDITLLPVDATRYFLHESAQSRLQDGVPSPNIDLDRPVIHAIHDEMIFQQRKGALEEMMDGFDWSETFYDPLEANTEAESFEDKISFNQLEFLVEQLSSFAVSGDREMEDAKEMMLRHWRDLPMERQMEDIMSGAYALHNRMQYINYGIDPDANPLISRDGNAFTDALIDYWEREQLLNNKTQFMKDNAEQLKNDVYYLGYGENLHKAIDQHLQEGKPSFEIHYPSETGNKKMESVLSFKKAQNSEWINLKTHRVTLELSNGAKRSQTYYINYGKGFTLKEAYNQLDGRAVEKDFLRKLSPEELTQFREELKLPVEQRGLPENWSKPPLSKAWAELDFTKQEADGNYKMTKYYEQYGFNLENALNKYAILEMDGGKQQNDLLQSLRKGNVQSVTIMKEDGQSEKMFVAANPSRHTTHLFDAHMKPVHKENLKQYQVQKADPGNEQKQDQKQTASKEQKNGQAVKQDSEKKAPRRRKAVSH